MLQRTIDVFWWHKTADTCKMSFLDSSFCIEISPCRIVHPCKMATPTKTVQYVGHEWTTSDPHSGHSAVQTHARDSATPADSLFNICLLSL